VTPSRFLARLARAEGQIMERVAIVVAHPDDEVIGVGSRLPRMGDVHVVYVTDGAPADLDRAGPLGFASREAYAAARADEALRGLALAGIRPERVRRLGFMDQRASLVMGDVTAAVLETLRELRPQVVITHPFENGHPDHDATALAVHLACRRLREMGGAVPLLIEFSSYHDPDGTGTTAVHSFLPADVPTIEIPLGDGEQELKRRLFAAHASQGHVLEGFPTDRECYREAPAYDFLAEPHPWRPLYETFFDTMTRERWQGLAAETLARFGVSGPI
jgi:LmbE family N-acetylglucosaminyl deacetylase